MKQKSFFFYIFILIFFLDSYAAQREYSTEFKTLEELQQQVKEAYMKKFDKLLKEIYSALDKYEREGLLRNFINQDYFQINFQDKSGQTILHIATGLDLSNIVKELLEKNADVNIQDTFGNTPLYLAIGTAANASNIVEP